MLQLVVAPDTAAAAAALLTVASSNSSPAVDMEDNSLDMVEDLLNLMVARPELQQVVAMADLPVDQLVDMDQ